VGEKKKKKKKKTWKKYIGPGGGIEKKGFRGLRDDKEVDRKSIPRDGELVPIRDYLQETPQRAAKAEGEKM